MTANPIGTRMFEEIFFKLNAQLRVKESVGNKAFAYEGKQGIGDGITVWRFLIYGGLHVKSEDADSSFRSDIFVFTGPSTTIRQLAETCQRKRSSM